MRNTRNNHWMSRRAREAVTNNEFPISHWTEKFSMSESQAEKLLIYMGVHHAGVRGDLIKFYRLPDKYDTTELMSIYHEFHSVSYAKKTFINIMSEHLQVRIADRYTNIPLLSKPRKRIKRKDWRKTKRRRRKYKVI